MPASEQYVAVVSAYKITTPEGQPVRDRGTNDGVRRRKSEEVKLTVKAGTLDALKGKVQAVLSIIDEEEFKS
jgi:hypothetical protein